MLRVLPPAIVPNPPLHHSLGSPFDERAISAVLSQIFKLQLHDPGRYAKIHSDAQGSPSSASESLEQVLEDQELAISLFAQETEALSDAARDDEYLEELALQEEMEAYDRTVALAIGEGRDPPPMPEPVERARRRELPVLLDNDEEDVEDSRISFVPGLRAALKHAALGDPGTGINDERFEELLSHLPHGDKIFDLLRRHLPLAVVPPPPPESCTVCGDDIHGSVVRLKCGHTFDTDCIQEMFKKASTDESLFPPKCCQGAVALSEVEPHLPHDFVKHYNRKAIEFSTPDRVYCHVPTCASFLGPAADAAATLRCAECAAGTCACCKEQTHPGVPCHFAAEDVVLDLGKEQGWQRCPACRHLVELSIGCYHITCRCGKQFCYVCAAPWKECDCPLFYVPPEAD